MQSTHIANPAFMQQKVNGGLNRGDVVQVYDKVEAEGTIWYMIKPGQWVDRNKIRVVTPSHSAPEGVDNGRWIEINLYEQTMTVYEDNHLVFATLIATGFEPYYTQPGLISNPGKERTRNNDRRICNRKNGLLSA